MPHRSFVDDTGRQWDAWNVTPEKVERRTSKPSVKLPFPDRRKTSEVRVKIGTALARGWLCFETSGEKRRLSPIPPGWDSLSDNELAALCKQAVAARPR
jgi:hypothetical protein